MKLIQGIKHFYLKPFDFKTETSLSLYRWSFLGSILFGMILGMICGFGMNCNNEIVSMIFGIILLFLLIYVAIASLALNVRRIRNLGLKDNVSITILTILSAILSPLMIVIEVFGLIAPANYFLKFNFIKKLNQKTSE